MVESCVLKQGHSLPHLTDLDDVWPLSCIKGQQGQGSAYKLLMFLPQSSYRGQVGIDAIANLLSNAGHFKYPTRVADSIVTSF